MDALAPDGDEGRSMLRKATGSCKRALIRGSPNGATRESMTLTFWQQCQEAILRELKHLST